MTSTLPPYSVSPLEQGYSEIETTVDDLSKELRALSLDIHDHPELAMKEYHTHDILCRFMRKHGFEVTEHAYDMPTAWEATFEHRSTVTGAGNGRTVGFNSYVSYSLHFVETTDSVYSEEDALPGVGHACGHPLIAIIGVASALAVAQALKKVGPLATASTASLDGRSDQHVWSRRLARHARRRSNWRQDPAHQGRRIQIDGCLLGALPRESLSSSLTVRRCHIPRREVTSAFIRQFGWVAFELEHSGLSPMLAIVDISVTYTGKGAHAAGAPWQGVNALDAAVLAYTNVSALRQQIQPSERVHGVIRDVQENGWVCNIVPAKSGLEFGVRSPTLAGLLALKERVLKWFVFLFSAVEALISLQLQRGGRGDRLQDRDQGSLRVLRCAKLLTNGRRVLRIHGREAEATPEGRAAQSRLDRLWQRALASLYDMHD